MQSEEASVARARGQEMGCDSLTGAERDGRFEIVPQHRDRTGLLLDMPFRAENCQRRRSKLRLTQGRAAAKGMKKPRRLMILLALFAAMALPAGAQTPAPAPAQPQTQTPPVAQAPPPTNPRLQV